MRLVGSLLSLKGQFRDGLEIFKFPSKQMKITRLQFTAVIEKPVGLLTHSFTPHS